MRTRLCGRAPSAYGGNAPPIKQRGDLHHLTRFPSCHLAAGSGAAVGTLGRQAAPAYPCTRPNSGHWKTRSESHVSVDGGWCPKFGGEDRSVRRGNSWRGSQGNLEWKPASCHNTSRSVLSMHGRQRPRVRAVPSTFFPSFLPHGFHSRHITR